MMNNHAQHNKNSLQRNWGGDGNKEARWRLKPNQNMDGLLQDSEDLCIRGKENECKFVHGKKVKTKLSLMSVNFGFSIIY